MVRQGAPSEIPPIWASNACFAVRTSMLWAVAIMSSAPRAAGVIVIPGDTVLTRTLSGGTSSASADLAEYLPASAASRSARPQRLPRRP